jgi:hypothetical protein
MIAARTDSQPPAPGVRMQRGSVSSIKLGNSAMELRTRIMIDDHGVRRLALGFWEAGRRVAELPVTFRTLPAFRAAICGAIKAALKTAPSHHEGAGADESADALDECHRG